MIEDYSKIRQLATEDVAVLEIKGKTYGDSWKSRGGVGAFMMLARKWDRIENISRSLGWDIFEAGQRNTGDILDDIADLRRYLLLVEAEVHRRVGMQPKQEMEEAGPYDPLSDKDGLFAGADKSYLRQGR